MVLHKATVCSAVFMIGGSLACVSPAPAQTFNSYRCVDGTRFIGARWTLVPGTHRIRALGAGGQRAEISITVE